jgi:hypothetical protein
MTTLMDTVRIDVPTRSPVKPAAPLDPPQDAVLESRASERSLRVGSGSEYRLTQWELLTMGRGQPLWREAA